MKALLIGATGATGKDLLELLLMDPEIRQVDIFVRRELKIKHEKLTTHIVDFDMPAQWEAKVKGDMLFSCLGTTLKIAGSKMAQWKVDYEYQFQFAKAARENGVHSYVLVSAENASAKSLIFYSRMKGKLEEYIKTLRFPKLIILNPPLLLREKSDRKGEVLAGKVLQFFNKFGLHHFQKPMHTKQLAKAMINSVKVLKDGTHSIKGQHILAYS